MMENNEAKKEILKDEQLNMDDLLKVRGGVANLRETPREKTVDISEDTKKSI